MATWEDGPEYAPLERPAEFSVPAVVALQEIPPPPQPAAGAPLERPRFDGPVARVAPLAELVPVVADRRDPVEPFAVVTSTLTSMDSAWGAAHRATDQPAHAAGPTAGSVPTALAPWPQAGYPGSSTPGAPVLPGGGPLPVPGYPPPPASQPLGAGGYPPSPSAFPPPGTPQWFGPGPAAGQPLPPAARTDLRAVLEAATPGLVICLVVGGLVWPLSLVLLGLAAGLARRAQVAHRELQWVFRGALGFLALVFLARLLSAEALYTSWWSYLGYWALALCWVSLVVVLVLVRRALVRSGLPQPPADRSSWG